MKEYQKDIIKQKLAEARIQMLGVLEAHQGDEFIMALKDRVILKLDEIKDVLEDISSKDKTS